MEAGVSFPAVFSTCAQCRGSWYSAEQVRDMLAAKATSLLLKEQTDGS